MKNLPVDRRSINFAQSYVKKEIKQGNIDINYRISSTKTNRKLDQCINTLIGVINTAYDDLLHTLILFKSNDLAKILINNGANINIYGHGGITPLHEAFFASNKEMIEFLLARGDLNIKLKWKRFSGIAKGGDSYLHICARNNYVTYAKHLILKGADITAKNARGDMPIHTAAREGNAKILALFLKDQDIHIINDDQDTPLHVAADSGQIGCIDKLLELGADANVLNFRNQVPGFGIDFTSHPPLSVFYRLPMHYIVEKHLSPFRHTNTI